MGTNGTVTVSNLKAATAIADDRISAHHPNGAGNTTSLGDFLIDAIGRWDSGNGVFVTDLKRVGSGVLAQGTQNNDVFEVDIDYQFPAGAPGDHWREQIGLRKVTGVGASGGLSTIGSDFNELNRSAAAGGNTQPGNTVRVKCEVTAFSNVVFNAELKGGLNDDATNHGTLLIYDASNDPDTDVWDDSARIYRIEGSENSVGDQLDLLFYLYDPNSNLTDPIADWAINPNQQIGKITGTASFNLGTANDTADISVISSSNNPHNFEVNLRDGVGGSSKDFHSFDYNKGTDFIKTLSDLH